MTQSLRATVLALTAVAAVASLTSQAAVAAGDAPHIEHQKWSFSGFNGRYDKNQLQRGFQVYQNVCGACHGLNRLSFRNLAQPGGPEFPEEAVKALAANWPNQILEKNAAGEAAVVTKDKDGKPNGFTYVKRAPLLSDRILGPYKNDDEARANQNGALPPDLSVIAKARNTEYHGGWVGHPASMVGDIVSGYQEGGPNYIHALLMGYSEPPAYVRDDKGHLTVATKEQAADKAKVERCASIARDEGKPDVCNKLADGMNYNAAYPGHQIAMGQPLGDGAVPYDKDKDGKPVAPETQEQYSRDVSAFLAWASDPTLNERKALGWNVVLYLFFTTLLLFFAKKRIWAKIDH
jgi:ubiquinol-cytochrome c reductase cytochrome c1 subunit